MAEEVRQNGFRAPLHPLQVVSWVVFGTDVAVYLIVVMPMIELLVAKIAVLVIYIGAVATLVAATFVATSCNPVDPYIYIDDSELSPEELDELPYCGLCNSTVQARSKHCRACNKCVADFDHHCMWLNNCIGGENYRAFFTSICSVGVMIGIVLCTIMYLFVDYATNMTNFWLRMQESLIVGGLSMEGFLGILGVMCFVNIPLWVLDMQLVLLHTFLMHHNMTTFDYIMNKKNQEQEQEDGEGAASKFKALPKWMDWIVFARCGQKRRKKKDNIEQIKPPPDGEQDVEAAEISGQSDSRTGPARPPGYPESDNSLDQEPKASLRDEIPAGEGDRPAVEASGPSAGPSLHKSHTDSTRFEAQKARASSPSSLETPQASGINSGGSSDGSPLGVDSVDLKSKPLGSSALE